MRAVVVERPGVYHVGEVDAPRPGPGEVAVEVRACGLCGTDVHIAHGQFPPAPYPLIPGHEFAGVVVAHGEGVASPAVGARVAVDPTLACGGCEPCREGHPNLCAHWAAIGDTTAGGLAERVAVPAANCCRSPQGRVVLGDSLAPQAIAGAGRIRGVRPSVAPVTPRAPRPHRGAKPVRSKRWPRERTGMPVRSHPRSWRRLGEGPPPE